MVINTPGAAGDFPEAFGFRQGNSSVHTSRTMMLAELSQLFSVVPQDASTSAYKEAAIEHNVFGKRTPVTRKRTFERLVELYGLDCSIPLFRILRELWESDSLGRPLLAGLCAHARDPLLRQTTPFVLQAKSGESIPIEAVRKFLEESHPGRFRPTTLLSAAQNIASSWKQCGYLDGRRVKKRRRPAVTPVNTAYGLLLAHLAGARGQLLFTSYWAKLLDCPVDHLMDLASEASRRGWIDYRNVGQVVEVRFPHLLTKQEDGELHG